MKDGLRVVLEDLFGGFEPRRYGEFLPFHPGVEILPLYGFTSGGSRSESGPAAALLRYAPGAKVPHHRHAGYEHILVIEGSQSDAHGTYAKGACVMSPPGTRHSVTSTEGCLVLAIWNEPVEVLHE